MDKIEFSIVCAIVMVIVIAFAIPSGALIEQGKWTDGAESGEAVNVGDKCYSVRECEAIVERDGKWYPARIKKSE